MITNATISRIDTPSANNAGDIVQIAGSAVAIRCFMDAPSRAQRYALEAVIAEATAVIYVALPAGTIPAAGGQLVIALDKLDVTPRTMPIVHAQPRVKSGGLSHWEIFAKGAA